MNSVRDVMTRSVLSVHRGSPLKEVAGLLIEHGISGVPVVDVHGTVVGVVSEADLLVKEQGPGAIHHRPLARLLGESHESQAQLAKLEAVTAADAMTSPALTIASSCSIRDAAALMTARRINRLPVVDDGKLVGIVTRADLVRAYVRPDDELASEIRQDVLLRMMWLDPALFAVAVADGNASIGGHVERRSTAEIIKRAIAMLPGMVSVHSELTWTLNDDRLQPVEYDPEFPFGAR